MKRPACIIVAILLGAVPAVGMAAAADEELDEVVVRGTKLWQMREAILNAEKRFYALYNELNTNDDFDVHCDREAPLGSRILRRVCRVSYVADAQAEYAQALLAGYDAPDPELVELERAEEFRATALQVINSDKRLLKLVRERELLEATYLEERRKRLKGRWILFE